VVNGPAAISRSTVLADVLNAPVAKLTMSNNINACQNLFDARALGIIRIALKERSEGSYLIFFEAILKDVLNNQATSLTKGHLMPHATKCLVNILHNLRGRLGPTKLKQLLPDVAGVAMNNRLGNATKQFVYHDSLIVLRDGIESLLNDMASKGIHGEIQGIATNSFSNLDDLFRGTVFKAALDQEVSKAVDHERISLGNNSLDNVVLLLRSADLELLL
jgi:hypothetical protein